jgi:pyridoxine 5-phosphate synthase
VCLVPERRAERTTEGGLDAGGQQAHLAPRIAALRDVGIRVSLFIAPEPTQIEAAVSLGAPVVELHTGAWCDVRTEGREVATEIEFQRITEAARLARNRGLEVHAGHGLDYASAERIAQLPEIVELNIGHFLIGEAVFSGLPITIQTMRYAMERGRSRV